MANANWKYLNRKTYLDAQARLIEIKQDLYNYDKNIVDKSGIYFISRENKPRQDDTITRFMYIGQAKRVLTRLAQHLQQFSQRIDISLKNRGLYYEHSNHYGWKISVKYCEESELNQLERKYIAEAQEKGITLYNITGGGQDEDKEDINERKAGLGYHDGIKQGKLTVIKEVKEYFDKYLNYSPKPIYKKAHKKNEAPQLQEIYVKKYNEFGEMLNGKEQNNENDLAKE